MANCRSEDVYSVECRNRFALNHHGVCRLHGLGSGEARSLVQHVESLLVSKRQLFFPQYLFRVHQNMLLMMLTHVVCKFSCSFSCLLCKRVCASLLSERRARFQVMLRRVEPIYLGLALRAKTQRLKARFQLCSRLLRGWISLSH